MKRLLFVAALVLGVLACAGAQTVVYKSQATLAWDAPASTTDGHPFLPGDALTYEVYIYNYTVGVADPQNTALLTFVAETPNLEQLIVFPYRAVWAAGVRCRLVDANGTISYSAIAWSYLEIEDLLGVS